MISRNGLFIFLMILLVSTMVACKSQRGVIKAPIKEEGSEYLFEKLKQNEFQFHTFDAKVDIEYQQGRTYHDFKGQIRIVKDSLIWVNFSQDLGIQIARIMISKDSVKFIDRIQKQYLITDYEYINNFLNTNIDFGILQSIILGNDFEYYEKAEFKAAVDGDNYRLSTAGRSKLKKYVRNNDDASRILLQTIWLDPLSFKIKEVKLKELTRDSKKLTATYSDFEPLGERLFPQTTQYLIETDDAISVEVKYSRISLNKTMNFPFKIPSDYTRTR